MANTTQDTGNVRAFFGSSPKWRLAVILCSTSKANHQHLLRWRRKFGQLAKVGSTSMKDGLYDWEAEAVHG